jgi:hypothetical protein
VGGGSNPSFDMSLENHPPLAPPST